MLKTKATVFYGSFSLLVGLIYLHQREYLIKFDKRKTFI